MQLLARNLACKQRHSHPRDPLSVGVLDQEALDGALDVGLESTLQALSQRELFGLVAFEHLCVQTGVILLGEAVHVVSDAAE